MAWCWYLYIPAQHPFETSFVSKRRSIVVLHAAQLAAQPDGAIPPATAMPRNTIVTDWFETWLLSATTR